MTDEPGSVVLRDGGTRLEVLTTGAAVRRCVLTDGDGTRVGVVLGHRDRSAYGRDPQYLGVVVGRLANRLAGGTFELDGVRHRVPALDRGNALHGGRAGFDTREWTVAEAGERRVRLTLVSPDGDQGFPGELHTSVTYTLEGSTVSLDYRARTSAPTLVNLTHHAYLNLDGEGSGSIDGHRLEVAAAHYLPTRADQLPTGEVRPVEGGAFDLRSPRLLAEILDPPVEALAATGGLDHHFVVDGTGLRFAARVVGESGRTLVVETDRPGVQVYTGAHLDGSAVGRSGRAYGPRAGLALEAQGFPDAPHHPHFPSVVLRPGEEFRSTTRWTFTPRP